MTKSIKRKTTDGLIWNSLEKFVSKGLQFIFSIFVARILMPEDYGLVAIANIFISLSDVLIDSGFSKALLRKKEKTEDDYNTVFYFNILMAVVLYALIWLAAPIIAVYYTSSNLVSIIRIISLILIFNAFCGVQSLHLITEMNFRKMAIFETVAMTTAGIVALVMAYRGLGVWALVIQTVLGSGIRAIFFWLFVRWTPSFKFSIKVLKEFFSFGSRLLLADYVSRGYSAIFSFTIGKHFSPAQLGNYSKADSFSSVPSSLISGPLSSVSYPALAEIQDDKERMKTNFYSMMGLTGFVIFPVLLGLFSVAQWLVPVALKSQWNGMIPYMQVLLLSYISTTLMVIPQNFLLILGRSKIILYIHFLSKGLGLLLFFILIQVSLLAVCIGIAIISFFSLCLTLFFLSRSIKYSFGLLMRSTIPSFITALLMSFLITLICTRIENMTVSLFVGFLIGLLSYIIISLVIKNENMNVFRNLIMQYFRR